MSDDETTPSEASPPPPAEEGADPAEASPAAEPEAPPKPLPVAEPVGRRTFLGAATVTLGACAGASVLGALGVAVVGTPLGEAPAGSELWVDLGPLSRFPEGLPVKVPIAGESRDAWTRFRARNLGSVVVIRRTEAAQTFSDMCPHNGCPVEPRRDRLVCPCHSTDFGLDGTVLNDGPSPRGLDPLDNEVVEGRLRVRFQRFQTGSEERRAL
jgi:Rieske Fe-S protein